MDRLETNTELKIQLPEDISEAMQANSSQMIPIREERERKDSTAQDVLIAVQGSKINFNSHMGELKILNDVPTTQGKLTGTIVEKQIPNFTFDDGFQMLTLTQWQDFGTAKVQDNEVLLKKSFLPGTGKLPGNAPPETGKIEFVDSGQINVPEKIGTTGAPVPENHVEDGCFCDRDIKLEELKLIVKQLRLSEKLTFTSLFQDENCPLEDTDKTYEKLLDEINKTFKAHKINTCIRKLHFFAQSYHETSRICTTLEYASGKGYNPGQHSESAAHGHTMEGDGPRYKGRGAMQLTWRDTQKKYFEYIIEKNPTLVGNKKIEELFNRKKQFQEKFIYYKDKLDKNNKPILNSKGKKVKVKVVEYVDVDGAGLLANNLHFAIDSAGWFWNTYKTIEYTSKSNKEKYKEILHKNLNEVSDYGDKYLTIISKFVNGGGNGMSERKVYYDELKKNVFKFDTHCVNRDKIKK